jgi:hypothetical protein
LADLQGDEVNAPSLLGLLVSWVVGCLLFVPLWAGLNFGFGTALDGPIGAFVMETPCQRLAGTTEPLTRYTLGGGKARVSSSVCHFASGGVRVADGQTDGLGFTGRELAYLVIGFVGYAACFAGAIVVTVVLVRAGRRLIRRPAG